MDFSQLHGSPRLLLQARLEPACSVRFQPTGFADLGAAEFKAPDGTPMLLVESAQSVANRLEKTCLDGEGPDIAPELKGLSYIAATLRSGPSGPIRTTSLVEAHRIGSPYFIHNKSFKATLIKEMAYDPQNLLDWKKIYATLFRYDANSLVHGVFLALLDGGRARVPRALTGFIEARGIERAVSGGVKNSPLDPKGELQVPDAESKGVYSNVPYSRTEYTAKEIKAWFNLDLSLIAGYGLPEPAARLLIALSLFKIRRFLTAHLRLRTACDLTLVGDVTATAPKDYVLPDEASLLAAVQAGIAECAPLFGNPPVTELETPVKLVKAKKEGKEEAAGDEQ